MVGRDQFDDVWEGLEEAGVEVMGNAFFLEFNENYRQAALMGKL